MKRFGVVLAALAGLFAVGSPAAQAAPYTADKAVKINVMGEWAHPDDDTSIIGPCGVWHQRYDVQCGIIMVTRGEGGGNATGTEIGPALGLRRENEDRVAHYRSGTIDIFNVDSVDFFYNTSAPLTQFFWGTETLRRITRIIRTTQPDIYIGFGRRADINHGNHQMAGRYIWEGVKAAADPNMFPEQLTGPNALSTWQVKKIFSGGNTAGTGGTQPPRRTAPTTSSRPRRTWTRSRACGPATTRRTGGRPATSRAAPRVPRRSGRRSPPRARVAYPTQSRPMYRTCRQSGLLALRHDRLVRAVPAERAGGDAHRPGSTRRSCSAPPSPIPAACRSARSSTSRSRASSTRRARRSRPRSTCAPARARSRPAPWR